MIRLPPVCRLSGTLWPYTRLFRSAGALEGVDLGRWVLVGGGDACIAEQVSHTGTVSQPSDTGGCATWISDTVLDAYERVEGGGAAQRRRQLDRKSTSLNSSH